MWTRIEKLARRLSRKRGDIAIVFIWTALVALLVIKAYWVAYNTSSRLIYTKPAYPGYDLSKSDPLDLLIVAVASVVVGLFLSDVKEMLYGYIAAMSAAFIVSVVYITLYIWYVLDLGPLLGAFAYDWEWAVFIATSIVFTLMFPWIISIGLIGLTIGAFLRTWVEWP